MPAVVVYPHELKSFYLHILGIKLGFYATYIDHNSSVPGWINSPVDLRPRMQKDTHKNQSWYLQSLLTAMKFLSALLSTHYQAEQSFSLKMLIPACFLTLLTLSHHVTASPLANTAIIPTLSTSPQDLATPSPISTNGTQLQSLQTPPGFRISFRPGRSQTRAVSSWMNMIRATGDQMLLHLHSSLDRSIRYTEAPPHPWSDTFVDVIVMSGHRLPRAFLQISLGYTLRYLLTTGVWS